MIHSPVRMCHPVSPSPNSVLAPCIPAKMKMNGIRKAKSVIEGRNRSTGLVLVCDMAVLERPAPLAVIVEPLLLRGRCLRQPEIHRMNAQAHPRKSCAGLRMHARHRSLAADATPLEAFLLR